MGLNWDWVDHELLLDHETALWTMILVLAIVLPIAFFIWCHYWCNSWTRTELYSPADAAKVLYDRRTDLSFFKETHKPLPECLAGVFWMDGSYTEELLLTFEGQEWNPDKRLLIVARGEEYVGSFNSGITGWMYWMYIRTGYFFGARVHIQFDDEFFERGQISWYLCKCIRMPLFVNWTMRREDDLGDKWEVSAAPICCKGLKCCLGSVTLRKVIDIRRKKVRPNWDDMCKSFEEGGRLGNHAEPDETTLCLAPPVWCYHKTPVQLVTGSSDAVDAAGICTIMAGGTVITGAAAANAMYGEDHTPYDAQDPRDHRHGHGSPSSRFYRGHTSSSPGSRSRPSSYDSPLARRRPHDDRHSGHNGPHDGHHSPHGGHHSPHDGHHSPHDGRDHHHHSPEAEEERHDRLEHEFQHEEGEHVRKEQIKPSLWRGYLCCIVTTLLLLVFIYALVSWIVKRPLFDCYADYEHWEDDWGFEKKMWCCRHEELGCVIPSTMAPETTTFTSTTTFFLPYNCDAAFLQWEKVWSGEKKAWCCLNFNRGCDRPTSTVPYDCEGHLAIFETQWSAAKKTWCCVHEGAGCVKGAAAVGVAAQAVVGAISADG